MDKNLQVLKTFSSLSLWDDNKDSAKGYASTKTEMQIETKITE